MRINRSDNEIYMPQHRQTASYYYATPDLILLVLWSIQSFGIYYDRKLDEYLFERRYAGIKRHGKASPVNSSRSWSESQSRTHDDRCRDDFSFETGEIRRCDRHYYHRFVASWPNSHQI
uniref:Uncharacterized protein n=1 Tax=Romanomermis culicivorax TaxID=13658 RepID=A0A915IRG4_ROMCU